MTQQPDIRKYANRRYIPEFILIGIFVAELLFLAYLLVTPSAFLKERQVVATATRAPQVVTAKPSASGGGLAQTSAPAAAKPAAQAGQKNGNDGKESGAVAGGAVTVRFSLANAGPADVLTGAASPMASGASLVGPDGKPVETLAIPAGGALGDDAGGVQLTGLTEDVAKGDAIPVTLTFEKAGDVALDVPVFRSAKAAADGAAPPAKAGDLSVNLAWAEPGS